MNRLTSPRQLLIGLDAMDWDLVRKWVAMNKLPTFRRLMEEGTQAELSTVADRLPDTVWNCLCSGLNPAYLARYFYVQHDPETGGLRYMPDDSSGADYFWARLSRAGRRVGGGGCATRGYRPTVERISDRLMGNSRISRHPVFRASIALA